MVRDIRLEGKVRVLVLALPPLSELIRLTLSHGPFEVQTVATTAAGREARTRTKPHLLIVDIDVQDGDPGELIGEVVGGRRSPTIVLTRRGDLRTKLRAFDLGADDYLSVPLAPDELLARCLALMRRTYGRGLPITPNVRVGDLEIDLIEHEVRHGKVRVHLTDMEQALLYLLVSNVGTAVTRDAMLNLLWGPEYVANSNLLDRHIHNLRVKLKDDARRPHLIRTIAGKGYGFFLPPA